jgi:hypothetical protein
MAQAATSEIVSTGFVHVFAFKNGLSLIDGRRTTLTWAVP